MFTRKQDTYENIVTYKTTNETTQKISLENKTLSIGVQPPNETF